MRDTTVQQFIRRYQVDAKQVARVERTALQLLGQLIPIGQPEHESEVRFLRWAGGAPRNRDLDCARRLPQARGLHRQ